MSFAFLNFNLISLRTELCDYIIFWNKILLYYPYLQSSTRKRNIRLSFWRRWWWCFANVILDVGDTVMISSLCYFLQSSLCFICSLPFIDSSLFKHHHELIPVRCDITFPLSVLAHSIVSFTHFGKHSCAQCLSSFWSILSLPCAHLGLQYSLTPLLVLFSDVHQYLLTDKPSMSSLPSSPYLHSIVFDTWLFVSLSFTNFNSWFFCLLF